MMKKMVHFAGALLLALFLTACGGGRVNRVETPSGMNMQRGRNYKEVIEDFEDKGFTNIRTEPIEDLLYGWVARNGEVEEIRVGGDARYDAGVWVPADTEVVIRYHTFMPTMPEDAQDAQEEAGPVQNGEAQEQAKTAQSE